MSLDFAVACIPFVVPPGQASIAGSGAPAPSGPTRPGAVETENEVVLRGAVHPQQVFRSQMTREIDVGAGYRVDVARGSSNLHGPYAELSYLPLQYRHAEGLSRFGLLSFGELLYRPGSDERGWGATLALSAEITTFASGVIADGGGGDFVIAAGHGEVGVGLFAGVTHRELDSRRATVLTAGVSGRLPASAGVICCLRK